MADATAPESAAGFLRRLGGDAGTIEDLLDRAAASGAAAGGAPAGGRTGTGAVPGRVVRAERIAAEVATPAGVFLASWEQPVSTGDWVVATPDGAPGAPGAPGAGGRSGDGTGISGHIDYVQARRTAFVRRAADSDVPQVLATNIDEVWVVIAADEPLSAARLERTLVLSWESGARPVVVFTKTDTVDRAAIDEVLATVGAVGPGVDAVAVSSVDGDGLAALAARVGPGRTAAMLGRSGAGKSSLVNALAGSAVAVGEVRAADGKGRHTTSWRELVVLPGGGALIDTPGLRGVGMWIDQGGLAAAFSDITELAAQCRFSDCAHDREPGCAVRDAIDGGTLDPARFARFLELSREASQSEARNRSRLDARAQRASAGRVARIRANDRRRGGD